MDVKRDDEGSFAVDTDCLSLRCRSNVHCSSIDVL
jgi:hypothetical protein